MSKKAGKGKKKGGKGNFIKLNPKMMGKKKN
jgi:hypothetical protein